MLHSKKDCIFCKIVDKKIPAQTVYEDESVLAFHDIHPMAPLHILFIPKYHTENLSELTSIRLMDVNHIFQAISIIVKQNDLTSSGYRVLTNTGKEGGQTVFHTHFHLLGGKKLGSFS